MEDTEEQRTSNGDHQVEEQQISKRKKGGFITMPFILANEAFERVASFGLTPNMIIYLMKDYKMSVTKAQNLLYFWNTANSFTPLVGALFADSLVGRFPTIGVGSIFSLLGMILLWMTTVLPHIKPPACNPQGQNCQSPTAGQYGFLILSFVLMSIGAGGIRPCAQAFGVDQVYQGGDNPKKKGSLEFFLNWYYLFSSLSIIIALTVIVYVQEHLGWRIGFGIPVILMFLATICFFLAYPFYVIVKGNKRLLLGLAQAIVAAFKNRKMDMPSLGSNLQYYHGKDSTPTVPSDRLRFLNKACIIQDLDKDIGPDGLPNHPWRLCKVEEVEGLKSFIRLIPIWSTGIMLSVNTSTSTFSLLLTRTMDRHLGPKFEIPAASFGTFLIIVIAIWIPLYDRVLIPLASKIRGQPVRLSVKLRMGIGLICALISMVMSGIVESVRRKRAIAEGFENNPQAVVNMSALWTVSHSVFFGLAEAFFAIGQFEFFYTELPKDMFSIAGAVLGLSGTFGSLIASLILNLTQSITKRGGKDGWIATNVNKGHYDYFYYLLAILNAFNVVYYIFCSRAYGPLGELRKLMTVEDAAADEELSTLNDTVKEDSGLSRSKELQMSSKLD